MDTAQNGWSVFSGRGERKYLTASELDVFYAEANKLKIQTRAFCLMLLHSGCRISEALALTRQRIDIDQKVVIIKCLKKRQRTQYRTVPLPENYINLLSEWFAAQPDDGARIWPWSRMTGYRRVRDVMVSAGITGEHATPKGLRHGFAVRALETKVPLNFVQRWLGHADLKTTSIYTEATGPEERNIAARMWQQKEPPRLHRPSMPHFPSISSVDMHDSENGEAMGWVGCSCRVQKPEAIPACPINQEFLCRTLRSDLGRCNADSREDVIEAFSHFDAFQQKKSTLARILGCPRLHYWLFCIAIFPLKSISLVKFGMIVHHFGTPG